MEFKKRTGPAYRAGSPSNVEIKLRVTKDEAKQIREYAKGSKSVMDYIRGRIL